MRGLSQELSELSLLENKKAPRSCPGTHLEVPKEGGLPVGRRHFFLEGTGNKERRGIGVRPH